VDFFVVGDFVDDIMVVGLFISFEVV